MKVFIYQIWFPTSKKCYIGQTKDLKDRMKRHLRSGSIVCKALWKYDDWQVTILHTTNEELANQLEIEDIRNHNSLAPNGYNLTAGGDGAGLGNQHAKGTIHSEETRKKLSKIKQGNQHLLGHKHSEETKKKMSKAHQGINNGFYRRKHSEETKEKNRQAHLSKKNPNAHSAQAEYKRLKTRLKKYEQES